MVREQSAKLMFRGSIPLLASKNMPDDPRVYPRAGSKYYLMTGAAWIRQQIEPRRRR
jgi:hypothetical protein